MRLPTTRHATRSSSNGVVFSASGVAMMLLLRLVAILVVSTSSVAAFAGIPSLSTSRSATIQRHTPHDKTFLLHQRSYRSFTPGTTAFPFRFQPLFSTNTPNESDDINTSPSSPQQPPVSITNKFVQTNPLIRDTARLLRRSSWFSWWSQIILTVIAAVILLFAQSVIVVPPPSSAMLSSPSVKVPSFFLSGVGIVISAASIIWTWGNGARLSRRLLTKPISAINAAQMVRRAIRVGVTINICGLLCHLLAAQQIIGLLAIKVLTRGGGLGLGGAGMWGGSAAAAAAAALDGALQPLDVLIVQANANQLLSQFCSLVSLLYLVQNVDQLDPPSTEEQPRR